MTLEAASFLCVDHRKWEKAYTRYIISLVVLEFQVLPILYVSKHIENLGITLWAEIT